MTEFPSLNIVGGLLPSSLLDRIFAGDPQVPGTAALSYGLERGESVRRQASRSWLYLLEIWQDHKQRVTGPDAAEATSARVTRERWLRILLRELGFHQLTSGSFEIDGKTFPVSNRSGHIPIHLLGWDTDLDHKTPHVTARAPQSMLQELLNRDDRHLWAILSNGTTLRLLRDSASLTGSAYLEFDLAAIFDGELFPDFVLLYLVCHESRFAAEGDGGPETCYLEQWRDFAVEQGERALNQLRGGVQQAISILGTGFLSNPANPQLRTRLANAELTLDDLNRALLRLVYRLLFWFVAEDRGLLLQPDPAYADDSDKARLREARDRYTTYFSSARLRRMARRHRGGRHSDLFDAAELVFDALGTEGGVPELALPGIGGIFETKRDDGSALPLDEPLAGARLSNEALLGAVRALSQIRPRNGGPMRPVDFGNLGAEELGSVYESLLELIPRYDAEQLSYTLETLPGNERKETGSYYTPTSLVDCLLDSALDPLLDEACTKPTPGERVAALLDITVCDPACGSGHFLVAAARRIAKRVAAEETAESEPPEIEVRRALRRVVGRCIYGVDVNPMAAELAKVSLWLEALEPGKPLSYLDQNVRVGNSLLGITPALLAEGLPDEAFKPIDGDDPKVAAALKKQNAAERQGQHDLFSPAGIPVTNAVLAKRAATVAQALPDSLEDLHIHQQRQAAELSESPELLTQKLLADAWCAAFVQPKNEETRDTAITQAVLEQFGSGSNTLSLANAENLVADLTRQYRFFHWHVEFPHIFLVGNGAINIDPATGWSGGFSCVIGNPPWERIAVEDDKFFPRHAPWVLKETTTAKRKAAIEKLLYTHPRVFEAYVEAQRTSAEISHLVSDSNRYPLTAVGRLTTQALFAGLGLQLIASSGTCGFILPTGVIADVPMKDFWAWLVDNRRITQVIDFENRRGIFPIHRSTKFSLLTFVGSGAGHADRLSVGMYLLSLDDLRQPGRIYSFPIEKLRLISPLTKQLPICKTQRDLEILVRAIEASQPSLAVIPWVGFTSEGSSQLWREASSSVTVSLYEGKMIHQFDCCFATYEGVSIDARRDGNPRETEPWEKGHPPIPRFYADKGDVLKFLARRKISSDWICVYRDYVRATDQRTAIAAAIPLSVPIQPLNGFSIANGNASMHAWALAAINSFAYDFLAKQKTPGQHFNVTIMSQIPLPKPDDNWYYFATKRAAELCYTLPELANFSSEIGIDGPPFAWEPTRRWKIRCELDSLFFHLYGLSRDDLAYVMESFPIIKRKDIDRYGSYRTKELILQVYDAMAEAMRTSEPYQTILDPPPGQGPRDG
jgi:hypothetical protein